MRTASIGLDNDTIEQAGRSIAGAVQVAEELPRDTGRALLDAAHQAFIPAFHAVMITSAAFCAAGIAITLIWLPHTRPRTEEL